MDSNELLGAIKAAVGQRFPGVPVHWEQIPQEPERPSFVLECQKEELADVSTGLVRKTVTVLVTCYAAADGQGDGGWADIGQRMETVMGLLGAGGVRAGGRAVGISTAKGSGVAGHAEGQAGFSWLDTQTGWPDPEGGTGPRMERYQIDVNGKEG